MVKKVNVYGRNTPKAAIRRSTSLTRTLNNVEMDTDRILELLKEGNIIAEILPDGTEEFLNMNNYNYDNIYEIVLERRENIKKLKEEKEKETTTLIHGSRFSTESKRIIRNIHESEERKFNDKVVAIINPDISEVVTVKDKAVEEKKVDKIIEYTKEEVKEEVVEKAEDINVVADVVEESTTAIDSNIEEALIEDVEDLR